MTRVSTVSGQDLLRQIQAKNRQERKEWLKFRSVATNPFILEMPTPHSYLSFRRTSRLFQEISKAYLDRKYLSTIILTGAFVEMCLDEFRQVLIDKILESRGKAEPDKYVNHFIRSRTGMQESADAKQPLGFYHLYFNKSQFRGKRRENFIRDLARWKVITDDASFACTQLTNLRNDHVHGNLAEIISRYKKDHKKLDGLFQTFRSKRAENLSELLKTRFPERKDPLMLSDETRDRFEKKMVAIAEEYWMLPCQTQVDYVTCIRALRRFIEGDQFGFLWKEEY